MEIPDEPVEITGTQVQDAGCLGNIAGRLLERVQNQRRLRLIEHGVVGFRRRALGRFRFRQ